MIQFVSLEKVKVRIRSFRKRKLSCNMVLKPLLYSESAGVSGVGLLVASLSGLGFKGPVGPDTLPLQAAAGPGSQSQDCGRAMGNRKRR
jgi:hypothetical protein